MGPLLRSGGTYAPAPAVVYGAPPVYSSLSLPATDPVLDSRSGSYAAADRQRSAGQGHGG